MTMIASRWYTPLLVCTLFLVLPACDGLDGYFEDLNTDPTTTPEMGPSLKLTEIQLRISGERYENWRTNLIYSSTMIQHLATLPTYWVGDKYIENTSYAAAMWDRYYPNIAKNLEDLRAQVCTSEDPEDVNRCAIARITRVIMYHRLTDLYGDIPYSEAGKGVLEDISQPVYDPQSAIYADMLSELEESAQMLDPDMPAFGTADLIYGYRSDNDEQAVERWRKFAYSMMLRLGMRLTKVDAGMAQEWVQKAIAGGVMESNDDIAYVPHDPASWRNGNSEAFSADGSPHLSEFFVEWMQEHDDPRLLVYGEVPVSSAPVVGLPNGYDATTIQSHTTWIPCEPDDNPPTPCGSDVYMDVNGALQDFNDPMFFQTYAEVELLLAEAALRGWHSGDAATHYENGVRAALSYLSLYGGAATLSDDAVEDYVAANPLDMNNAMEEIHTQYWAAVFLNEYEAFANWRRTGYPELTPTNHPANDTEGTIPRRLLYNRQEQVTNTANYNAALDRQGWGAEDLLTDRMWWDVED